MDDVWIFVFPIFCFCPYLFPNAVELWQWASLFSCFLCHCYCCRVLCVARSFDRSLSVVFPLSARDCALSHSRRDTPKYALSFISRLYIGGTFYFLVSFVRLYVELTREKKWTDCMAASNRLEKEANRSAVLGCVSCCCRLCRCCCCPRFPSSSSRRSTVRHTAPTTLASFHTLNQLQLTRPKGSSPLTSTHRAPRCALILPRLYPPPSRHQRPPYVRCTVQPHSQLLEQLAPLPPSPHSPLPPTALLGAALSSGRWSQCSQPTLISFYDTSMHAFPAHRTAALLLFELLHPSLYSPTHSLHSLLRQYTAQWGQPSVHCSVLDRRVRATAATVLRSTRYGSIHSGVSAFRHIWSELLHYTTAMEWRQWEATCQRLQRRLSRRWQRMEEAEEEQRLAAVRRQLVVNDLEEGAAALTSMSRWSWSFHYPALAEVALMAEAEGEKQR